MESHPTFVALSPWVHEIEIDAPRGMRVRARIFADKELLARMQNDRSIGQLMNVATLPGIVDAALGMPDML